MSSLAIVIPAYNPDFLRDALESLATQTDRRFRLYVGDDAGPPAIARIVSDYTARLDVVYRRFDENLGGRSLVSQWNRCIALTTEPWIWLFSDDDVMSPDCVATLLAQLESPDAPDVMRFDTQVIDARGALVRVNPPHPLRESGVDFVFSRLSGQRHSYVVEYVFRRKAYDRVGGFPEYPVAWCADDAAWFLFSGEQGIRTLPAGRVSWRASGRNISTSRTRHRPEKLVAAASFLRFVHRDVIPLDTEAARTPDAWARACERWYLEQLRYPVPIGPRLWPVAFRDSRDVWRVSVPRKLATLSLWTLRATFRTLLGRK